MSQSHDLHRALLRPAVIYILRAAGFHSTKPSVLDTLTNLAERHLLLLASATARHAANAHNDTLPTITDVRMALVDGAVLMPTTSATEEHWTEIMRRPIADLARAVNSSGNKDEGAAQSRARAAKRQRDADDVDDVRALTRWFDGPAHLEMHRVAALGSDAAAAAAAGGAAGGVVGGGGTVAGLAPSLPMVGVGGSVVQAEDFLTALKKKHHGVKAGGVVDENARFVGTVLGAPAEDRQVVLEGGPVQSIAEWKPRVQDRPTRQDVREERVNGVHDQPSSDLGSDDADVLMT